MDAITKFKEAAKAFQQEERYLTYAEARKENDQDPELQGMLSEFTIARKTLNDEMAKSKRDDEVVKETNARINDLYNKIMKNEKMLAYNKSKDDIENFMNYVNAILNAAIDGDDPMQVEEPQPDACAGSCSSCAGCG